ncbi:hypothetical protein pdam_00024927, partial [Pocillopora damicornis]
MTDLVLVDCYLPQFPVTQNYFSDVDRGTAAAGLMISVSNDGEHKSVKNLTFLSYDSACMTCNISSGCFFKASLFNLSLENQNEINPNEKNPTDWCYQCLPKVNTTSWTKRQANLPPTFSPTTEYFAVSGEALQLTIDVNNGTCMPHPNKPRGSGFYACNCMPGFTGENCETNIDDCRSFPCIRGRCIDGINTYRCICDPGYVGRKCDSDYDDCSSSPCAHGNCTDYTGAYRCTCDPGYRGPNCTEDINECESSPCAFGACVDHVNKYSCVCDDGYKGYDCDVEIDECLPSPCIR